MCIISRARHCWETQMSLPHPLAPLSTAHLRRWGAVVTNDWCITLAWFFPSIIIVTLNVTQTCQCHISRLLFYPLNMLYRTVTWEFRFTNEISKKKFRKCITNRADWMSSSVLHCNDTVAAWRSKNTLDVGTAFWCLGKLAGDENY